MCSSVPNGHAVDIIPGASASGNNQISGAPTGVTIKGTIHLQLCGTGLGMPLLALTALVVRRLLVLRAVSLPMA
eukprot:4433704-Amphidinium_carterae.1